MTPILADSAGAVMTASALGVAALMIGTWLLSLVLHDVSIVDIVWGAGFVVVAWISFVVGDGVEEHPNYFGDCCVWWGLFVIALEADGGWRSIIGPLVMTVFLVRVSGVAMLERSLKKRRPEYADHIARTSAFVPWPPTRS